MPAWSGSGWLLSRANSTDLFEAGRLRAVDAGLAPDPETVDEARANPEVLATTGGWLAQMLAGQGLSAVTVAVDPGVFRGVLPLPVSVLKGVGPS